MGKPKIQIPKPKQIPRSQIPKPGICSRVGIWNLELIWSLGFGFWNFAHGMENFCCIGSDVNAEFSRPPHGF
jgi:hypothetical protein